MEWNITNTYDHTLDEDIPTVTVTIRGKGTHTARRDHPNFAKIVKALNEGMLGQGVSDEEMLEFFDIAKAVEDRFARLSERIAVRGQKIYFDNDEISTGLSRQILEFFSQGVDDWRPLVNFWEKLSANPNDHSREQFWTFVNNHKVTVFPDGDFVGYKGCRRGEDGILYSTTNGHAIVDNVDIEDGPIPNQVGSIIEMPRSEVKHDPYDECNAGLHIGTYDFAKSYASRGSMLIVKVNPRDVVSVPHSSTGQKTRVCRYEVIDENIKQELVESLVGHDAHEGVHQAVEAVEDLKEAFAKKQEADDGVIKVGSYVRLKSNHDFEGTVVSLENYHGELQVRRDGLPDWVAERHELEIAGAPDRPYAESSNDLIDDIVETVKDVADQIEQILDQSPDASREDVEESLGSLVNPCAEILEEGEAFTVTDESYDPNEPPEMWMDLSAVLETAILKARRAKKSQVLTREMLKAGYEPKPGIRPVPSKTTEEDWQVAGPQPEPKGKPSLDERPSAENPTEEEFAQLLADAKKSKKGPLAYLRQKGWLFVADLDERSPSGARIRTNWARRV